MRVANKTLYESMRYRLGNLTTALNNANEVVTTGNRINRLSDDPVGLTQVLDLKSSINNINQLEKNISVGKNWLTGTETSLSSVNELIIEANIIVSQMINGSSDQPQRADMVEHIDGILRQIVSLGNTEVNGSYVFSGSKTNVKTFTLDDDLNPTKVIYNGDDTPFPVKSDKVFNLAVGRNGEDVFWDEEIRIDDTNNEITFKEDIGRGNNYTRVLTATIPSGTYQKSQLPLAIRNAMNEASKENGYGVEYNVSFDDETGKYKIQESGEYSGYMAVRFMWESASNSRVGNINTGGSVNLDDVSINILNQDLVTLSTPTPSGTEPIRFTWDGNGKWKVDNNPGYTLSPTGEISGTADELKIDLSDNDTEDIVIRLANPAIEAGDYIEFDLFAISEDHSIAPDIGFKVEDIFYTPHASDIEVDYVTNITIGYTNDRIDFEEVNSSGISSGTLTAAIPRMDYTDPDTLALAIENAMELVSVNGVDYTVSYDSASGKFDIQEESTILNNVNFLWHTGPNSIIGTSAASTLGYTNTENAKGSFGGDLLGTNNWDIGDTINLKFTDGTNVLEYSHTVGATDTNTTIYTDMQKKLTSVFGSEATFTVNGNNIDFQLQKNNRAFTISDVTDDNGSGTGNNAFVDISVRPATGRFGGDLIGWGLGDNITIDFTDGVNTLNYNHTVSNAIGSFGGDLMGANNWNVGDTISFDISDGHNTLYYSRTILGGDTNAIILGDIQAQMGATFGTDVTSGVVVNDLNFSLNFPRTLSISNFTDNGAGGGGSAQLDLSSTNLPSSVVSTITAGAGDLVTFDSDTPETMLSDIQGQLSAVFGTDATFTVQDNYIYYELSQNRRLGISPVTDDDGGGAGIQSQFFRYDDQGTVLTSPPPVGGPPPVPPVTVGPGGEIANFFGIPADDDITFPISDRRLKLVTIDRSNNKINFEEVDPLNVTTTNLTATIPDGDYGEADLGDLCLAIKTALETESAASGNTITYDVSYNATNGKFTIQPNAATPLNEVHFLWNTGPDSITSAAATLGFDNSEKTKGSFGGDLTGALNWDMGDTVSMDFSDGINTLNYAHTVSTATGSFGGDLVNSGWDVGETVTATFSDGVNSLNYIHTVIATDTTASLLTDIQTQLTVAFGGDAVFAVVGNDINFTLNTPRDLTVSGFSDGGEDDAKLNTVSVNLPTSVNTYMTSGTSVTTFASDSTSSILDDLRKQLSNTFGSDAKFTVNGNNIDFELTQNRLFDISNFNDDDGSGSGNNAEFAISGQLGLPVSATPTITAGGNDARFYAIDDEIGPSIISDNAAVLIQIGDTNNSIDFEEVNANGIRTGEISFKIPNGDYSDMNALATAIQNAMKTASSESGNSIDYVVSYNSVTKKFVFKENGTGLDELRIFWATGSNNKYSAASTLGFNSIDDAELFGNKSDEAVVNITIDSTNNIINFKELLPGEVSDKTSELTAKIETGIYTSFEDLSEAIEKAMELESSISGNTIDYAVSFDAITRKFTIKESGTTLDSIELLWASGLNKTTNAGAVLGFYVEDDISTVTTSDKEVEWGIFRTLIDLKTYLEENDVDGISRSMTRLEYHFDHMRSTISDVGIKYNRLEIREKVSIDMNFSLTERRTMLEEADIIDAVMELKSKEIAYEAALSSSARVLQVSLADYL